MLCKEGYNGAKQDKMLQNAAPDQGLNCLLKLQEVKGYIKQEDHYASLHSKTVDPPVQPVL